jgi:hypothetical protein
LAVGVFGSGDCPATPSVWRYAEVDAELRAWKYQKSQSPLLAMENDAQLRFGAIFEMRLPRRQKLGIFGVLIDQSPSGPRPHAGFGLSWQDDDHGDCGLCQRQARNFVSIFGLRKTERPYWDSRRYRNTSRPASRSSLTANRRHTMATAVCGNATRAASDEFSGFAKIKPAAGQSPPTENAKRQVSSAIRQPLNPLNTGSSYLADSFPRDTCR